MKITIFKHPGNQLTMDYDLTTITACELTKALYVHCQAAEVVPSAAAVIIPEGHYKKNELYVIKTTTNTMSMQEVAEEILKIHCGVIK